MNHKRHKMYLQLFDYFLFKTWKNYNWFLLHTNLFIFLFERWLVILVTAKKSEAFEPYKQKRLTKQNTKINTKIKNKIDFQKQAKCTFFFFEYFFIFDKGFLKSESMIIINLAWNDYLHISILNILIGVIISTIRKWLITIF